jgi:predicted anti-sigma-YlaC factor YlaD
MLTCDEAFDFLTSPARHDSEELALHLAECPRCRQMREVLSPALGVLQSEPFGATSESAIPPSLSLEAIQLAETSAARLRAESANRPPALKRRHRTRVWGAASAVLLLLGGIYWSARGADPAAVAVVPMLEESRCLWKHPESERRDSPPIRSVVLSCVACHLDER